MKLALSIDIFTASFARAAEPALPAKIEINPTKGCASSAVA
jgi:hypothetical protein